MRRRTPHALLLAIVLVGTLLAGCGPSSGRLELLALSSASEQTADEKTARMSIEVKIRGREAGAEAPEFKGEGLFDLVGNRADITYAIAGQSVRMLLDGGTIYQSFPALSAQLGGKKWMKLELSKVAERAGISGTEGLFQGQGSDASMGLDYLRSLAGKVTKVGPETVRGAQTTHYRGRVDMARAAREAPESQRRAIEQLASRMGITSIPLDVWIDDAGRIRRLRQTIDYSNARSTPELRAEDMPRQVQSTIELFDFGVPFDFVVPPAEEVFDGSEIFDQLPRNSDPDFQDPDYEDPDFEEPDLEDPDYEEPPSPASLALADRILRSVPGGYREGGDSGDSGPVDIEEAIDNDEGDDAREALTSAGFVAGYTKAWERVSGPGDEEESFDGIFVLIFQFRSGDGARTYGSRLIAQAREDFTSSFEVEGIPGARGLLADEETLDLGGGASIVVMGRGNYLAAVVVAGSDGGNREMVTNLAQQQYRLLSG